MKPTLFKMKNRIMKRGSETPASIITVKVQEKTLDETKPIRRPQKTNIYSMMARCLSPRKPELNCTTPILSTTTSRYKKLSETRQTKFFNDMTMETIVQEQLN